MRRILVAALLAPRAVMISGCDQVDQNAAPQARPTAGNVTADSDSHAGAIGRPAMQGRDATDAAPSKFDAYASVLAQVVDEEGLVRYGLLSAGPTRQQLDSAVAAFAITAKPAGGDLAGCKALWINTFNANAMRMAADESRKAGFTTVNEVPGFFDQRKITVAGEAMTLTALRDRLRELKDPRAHAALVSAAKGSPAMFREPFTATAIDSQLDRCALQWLEDHSRNRASRDGLRLSAVFEQFATDFEVEPYRGALGFVRKHSRPNGSIRDFLRSVDDIRIRPIPFDWTLNDAGGE